MYFLVAKPSLTLTSHVGVFALTQQLQPLLRNAALEKDADVRIVMVSIALPSLQPFIPHLQ